MSENTPGNDYHRIHLSGYIRHITARRHPSVRDIARFFDFGHLPDGLPRITSMSCAQLAADMIEELPDSPELTTGLRKLLEAKDCFARAAIVAAEDGSAANQGSVAPAEDDL